MRLVGFLTGHAVMIDEDGSVTCDSHGRPLNPKGNESYESDKKIVNLKEV